ncbi:hypothetical protein B0T16DRAFT_80701 [Cercophora newfieldiana]|uniref:C2H2-type domain-containing protein n=1 Tax=Cercophora newfieldiana TaxID=92897 RepID=A0AA39YFC5_9PEZI|nr:hypothetical protein B0T16DRAFT_80701 [Cercophora newfieldiana]
MELTNLRVGTTMKTEFSDSDGFGFDAHVMGYPPSSASSFSSDSSFGPFTPTSGRSTPPGSDGLDINTSFSSAGPFSFDLTPPSSAMSAYFHLDMKSITPEDPCALFQPRLLATPSRNHFSTSGLPYSNDFNSQTPSQPMDLCTFTDGLGPSPLPLTPMRPVQGGESWDPWPMWVEPESPLFDSRHQTPLQQPVSVKHERESPASCLADNASRRRFFNTVKDRATALHQVQQESPSRSRQRPSKKDPNIVVVDGLQVKTIRSEKHFCKWAGCTKRFQKKEHLVRHIDSAHKGVLFKCEWCDKLFNRTDNRRSHEELHGQQRKQSRVKYVPEAARRLAEEKLRSRVRKPSKSKVSKH